MVNFSTNRFLLCLGKSCLYPSAKIQNFIPNFYSFILCKYTLLTTTKSVLFLCTRKFQGKKITFLTLTRQFFLHTTPIDIINSWGISKMYATQIVKNVNGEDFTMAALVMQVNGSQFQGKVYIALDEGSDYYRIYGEKNGTTKEYHHDIAFDELDDVLDSMIETGGMTKEEYQAKERTLFVVSNIKSFDAKLVLNTRNISLF